MISPKLDLHDRFVLVLLIHSFRHWQIVPANITLHVCLLGAKPLNQKVSNALEGSWLKKQLLFLGVSTNKETQMVCTFACTYYYAMICRILHLHFSCRSQVMIILPCVAYFDSV
jgi:hypothetical protein